MPNPPSTPRNPPVDQPVMALANVRLLELICERLPVFVKCRACTHIVRVEVARLLQTHPATMRLGALEDRLTCARCDARQGEFVVRLEDAHQVATVSESERKRRWR